MSKLTQNAIKASFIRLLDRKPIDHITIKDITDDCGISRNTFYYHYTDLPTLLEEVLTDFAEDIMKSYPTVDSLEECLNVGMRFVLGNRRIASHIYHSSHRYLYEKCLMKVCKRTVSRYFDMVEATSILTEREREIMIDYYKCLSFGLIIDWCDNGMKENDDFMELFGLRRRFINLDIDI